MTQGVRQVVAVTAWLRTFRIKWKTEKYWYTSIYPSLRNFLVNVKQSKSEQRFEAQPRKKKTWPQCSTLKVPPNELAKGALFFCFLLTCQPNTCDRRHQKIISSSVLETSTWGLMTECKKRSRFFLFSPRVAWYAWPLFLCVLAMELLWVQIHGFSNFFHAFRFSCGVATYLIGYERKNDITFAIWSVAHLSLSTAWCCWTMLSASDWYSFCVQCVVCVFFYL